MKEVDNARITTFPQRLAKLKEEFLETLMVDAQWVGFELQYKGDVDKTLTAQLAKLTAELKFLIEGDGSPVNKETTPPEHWPLNTLKEERDAVKREVGMDGQKQLRYEQIQKQLQADEKLQQTSEEELKQATGAQERIQKLLDSRRKLYITVFQTFLDEKLVLEKLCEPLKESLRDATGSLKRLNLSVSREIDLDGWVEEGKKLLDLRRDSTLRGHGGLEREARKGLTGAWKTGTAEQVGTAMQEFINETHKELLKSMPLDLKADKERKWIQQVASWLYSTDHITMQYSITYDGVAIEQLSPGTRGIVLLLLYLVIDRHDNRPLIIDQPEENLDPKSVFDELVPHFREARKRRQVIIVTHNANLVVNTDADQVIVASSEPNPGGGLPTVSYHAGSLENGEIRRKVCEILEGGEQAFLDRERRYRLQLEAEVQSKTAALSPDSQER